MNIPLYKVLTDSDDVAQVKRIIERGTDWTNGPEVKEFEDSVANYVGSRYCVSFNSGTSALHASLLAHGIGGEDEVIVPSFTFIATANAALFVNAKPIFADVEAKTHGLEPMAVKGKINKRTKAIIPVHVGGRACNILELKQIAQANKILLIEDAAEAIGAKINGQNLGTIGDSSIISFCGNKVMTTGEGGAVLTDSQEIFRRLKLIRSHGREDVQNYFTTSQSLDYVDLGYNWRISSITAAIGLSQMKKIDTLIRMRRQNALALSYRLSRFRWMKTPVEYNDRLNVYQMYTIEVSNPEIREKLRSFLSQNGITCKVYFDPIHESKFYKQKLGIKEVLPVTEDLSKKVLTLPMYPSMTTEEIDYIVQTISKFSESSSLQ